MIYISTKSKSAKTKIALSLISLIVAAMPLIGYGAAKNNDNLRVPLLQNLIESKKQILGKDDTKVLKLTLEECIKSALANNYDIQIAAFEPAISMDDLTIAESYFDATLVGSVQYDSLDQNNTDATYTNKYLDNNGNVTSQRIIEDGYDRYHNYSYSIGLRKALSTGTEFQITQSSSKINDLIPNDYDLFYDPFVQYSLDITVKQPLLRNFGVEVNRASIRAQRSMVGIAKQQFQLQVISTMLDVEHNYWLLFFYRQHVKIRQQLLERAEVTLERVLARNDYDGKSSSIARSKSVIEEARADMLDAKNMALRQQETLLDSINNPAWPIRSNCEIITMDNPQRKKYDISFDQAVETALEYRPELIAQKYGVDIADLRVMIAKNQVLPNLDLFVTHTIYGAGTNYDMAFDKQLENDVYSWSFGLSMEYPIANRAAKATLSQVGKKREQEELTLKSMQEQILYDVCVSLHDLHNKYSETTARLDAVNAARNELLNYLAIQDTDRKDSNSPEFLNLKLNADDRLSRNQIAAVQAMIEYDMAIMNIHRAQGCLEKYNNVNIKIDD